MTVGFGGMEAEKRCNQDIGTQKAREPEAGSLNPKPYTLKPTSGSPGALSQLWKHAVPHSKAFSLETLTAQGAKISTDSRGRLEEFQLKLLTIETGILTR